MLQLLVKVQFLESMSNWTSSDFANDILRIYKSRSSKFCSRFSVKFDNETSVGSGPVREFFSLVMKMLVDGFPLEGGISPKLSFLKMKMITKFLLQILFSEIQASTSPLEGWRSTSIWHFQSSG